jgi:hypothetical protein
VPTTRMAQWTNTVQLIELGGVVRQVAPKYSFACCLLAIQAGSTKRIAEPHKLRSRDTSRRSIAMARLRSLVARGVRLEHAAFDGEQRPFSVTLHASEEVA